MKNDRLGRGLNYRQFAHTWSKARVPRLFPVVEAFLHVIPLCQAVHVAPGKLSLEARNLSNPGVYIREELIALAFPAPRGTSRLTNSRYSRGIIKRQQSCGISGFGVCPDGNNCCKFRWSCCSDSTCCPPGFTCYEIDGTSGCCADGYTCLGLSSQCQDDGYEPCLGSNSCCPSSSTCDIDSNWNVIGETALPVAPGATPSSSSTTGSLTLGSAYTWFSEPTLSWFTMTPSMTAGQTSSVATGSSSSATWSSASESTETGSATILPIPMPIPLPPGPPTVSILSTEGTTWATLNTRDMTDTCSMTPCHPPASSPPPPPPPSSSASSTPAPPVTVTETVTVNTSPFPAPSPPPATTTITETAPATSTSSTPPPPPPPSSSSSTEVPPSPSPPPSPAAGTTVTVTETGSSTSMGPGPGQASSNVARKHDRNYLGDLRARQRVRTGSMRPPPSSA
ncbi:hypothetical protein IE53DRAFT_366889 [Violaceomyces palustris]|uniref:Uncharacterized protein n=1 Tax=Violaceomyces palustris TaxID=1673888 RepID=A0ACD0P3Y5_9BASI|nr:hypothetical protein IE53DRAFT_366889 [Violaceomyces palustris]